MHHNVWVAKTCELHGNKFDNINLLYIKKVFLEISKGMQFDLSLMVKYRE